jgi:hypothetical protein
LGEGTDAVLREVACERFEFAERLGSDIATGVAATDLARGAGAIGSARGADDEDAIFVGAACVAAGSAVIACGCASALRCAALPVSSGGSASAYSQADAGRRITSLMLDVMTVVRGPGRITGGASEIRTAGAAVGVTPFPAPAAPATRLLGLPAIGAVPVGFAGVLTGAAKASPAGRGVGCTRLLATVVPAANA